MANIHDWEERYVRNETPWDTGKPSSELERVLLEAKVRPCRPCSALEIGCGTGANAIWLAQQGFDVTALDVSPLAIDRARENAREAGATVQFLVADVLHPPAELSGPFDFFFDRGCYHAVRRDNVAGYIETLRRLTHTGTTGLILAGNAREPHEPGPPVVTEDQIRTELGSLFEIVQLREFRFDQVERVGVQFLGWSCLLRR
jgi:SAM-dependent methyltransferase